MRCLLLATGQARGVPHRDSGQRKLGIEPFPVGVVDIGQCWNVMLGRYEVVQDIGDAANPVRLLASLAKCDHPFIEG